MTGTCCRSRSSYRRRRKLLHGKLRSACNNLLSSAKSLGQVHCLSLELRDLSLRSLEVLNELGPQIQWLHSYVTEDKVYCVYLAPDENIIREHARRVGIPADRVSAVRRLIDPAKLK